MKQPDCFDPEFKYTRSDAMDSDYLKKKFEALREEQKKKPKARVVATIEPERKKA